MPRKAKGERSKRRENRAGTLYWSERRQRWIVEYTDPSGNEYSRSAQSEREAKAKLEKLIMQATQGLKIGAADRLTVNALLDQWLGHIKSSVKPKTLEGHSDIVGRYIRPVLGDLLLSKLTRAKVKAWYEALRKRPNSRRAGETISETTVRNALRRFRSALAYAVEEDLIAKSPASFKLADQEKIERRALDEQQITALLAALEDHRLYPLFALAATTGMRLGELMGLQWKRIDLHSESPTLVVAEQLQYIKESDTPRRSFFQSPKSDAGKREIPLTPTLVALLKAHRAAQAAERLTLGNWQAGDLVFSSLVGTPLDPNRIRKVMQWGLKRAQLPHVTFHSLRHSAGSIMLARSVPLTDVSKILGHSTPAITARIYAHSFTDGKRRAMAAVDSLIAPRKVS